MTDRFDIPTDMSETWLRHQDLIIEQGRKGDVVAGRWKLIGGPVSYTGDKDCTNPGCRRRSDEPGCVDYHCAVCHEPSGMTGHAACRGEE